MRDVRHVNRHAAIHFDFEQDLKIGRQLRWFVRRGEDEMRDQIFKVLRPRDVFRRRLCPKRIDARQNEQPVFFAQAAQQTHHRVIF